MTERACLRDALRDTLARTMRARFGIGPNRAADEGFSEVVLSEILDALMPPIAAAIQQARDDAEDEIASLQRALEAWAARERAADRVRETISKKGHP